MYTVKQNGITIGAYLADTCFEALSLAVEAGVITPENMFNVTCDESSPITSEVN